MLGRSLDKAERYDESIRWYRKAADQGHAKAVKWYRKAANQGHSGGQCNLGLMYYNGEGVQEDRDKAISWWKKSAEQGDKTAIANLTALASERKERPYHYEDQYNYSLFLGHSEWQNVKVYDD